MTDVSYYYRFLDISGINSFKIFRANNPNKNTIRRTYTYILVVALMEENLKHRTERWTLSQEPQEFIKKSETEATTSTWIIFCYCC